MSPSPPYTLRFTPKTEQDLLDLQTGLGRDRGELITDALSLYRWAYGELRAGSKLLVQRGHEVTEFTVRGMSDVR